MLLEMESVVPPWLLNLYMGGVMREMDARVIGRSVGLDQSVHEWKMSRLLYADDTVLLSYSAKCL